MKVFEVLTIENPVLTSVVVYRGLMEMPEKEFGEHLHNMLAGAKEFASSDDRTFSGFLDPTEAITYASFCQSFTKALHELEANRGNSKQVAGHCLAETIAWWQLITRVREYCGPMSETAEA